MLPYNLFLMLDANTDDKCKAAFNIWDQFVTSLNKFVLTLLRILEFEQSGIQVNGRNVNAEVEMWDVSGDHK